MSLRVSSFDPAGPLDGTEIVGLALEGSNARTTTGEIAAMIEVGAESQVASLLLMTAIPAPVGGNSVKVTEPYRGGSWVFRSGDHSTKITLDPYDPITDTGGGLYRAPDFDLTGLSGAWERQYNGNAVLSWWGPDALDAGPAIELALTALPFINIFATPMKKLLIDEREFLISTQTEIAVNCELVGAGGIIRPHMGNLGGKMLHITADYFRSNGVEMNGGGVQPIAATGNLWLYYVDNPDAVVEIINPRFIDCMHTDSNIANTGAKNLLVCHPVYVGQGKSLKTKGGTWQDVSGAAVFVNNCGDTDIDGGEFNNVHWYNVNFAKNCNKWTVQNCNFRPNHPEGVYWGGAIQTVDDFGEIRCKNGLIRNNWFEGVYSYGGIIRLQSADGCEVDGNVFAACTTGTWGALGGDSGMTYIRVVTRAGGAFSPSEPNRNIYIHDNIAPFGCAEGVYRYFIYVTSDGDYAGVRNAAKNIKVDRNICFSPDPVNAFFDTGLNIGGQVAGIERISFHDNDFQVKTVQGGGGPPTGVGCIGISAGSALGQVLHVRYGGNNLEDIGDATHTYQVGIFIQANVDDVRVTRPNTITNFYYPTRTTLGTGPNLEYLDDDVIVSCTNPSLFSQTLSRLAKPAVTQLVNADKTLTQGSQPTQYLNVALTGARTITLPAPGYSGRRFRIVRSANATGAAALNINTSAAVLVKALAVVSTWAEVQDDGTEYRLIGYGAL